MNDFLTIDMITLEALAVLENELTFTRQIPRKYDDYFAKSGAKIGSTLRVRKPIRNVVRTGQGYQPQPLNETFVNVVLNEQAGVDCDFSTADFTLRIDEFSRRILKPQIAQIANYIDDKGLQLAIQANMAVGTPGVAATTPATFLAAGAKLKEAAAPLGDWCMVINPQQEANIVGNLTTIFNPVAEISRQYKKGIMGTAFGFEWYMDQNVFTHTVGALGVSTPIVAGAGQSGSTIDTSGWAVGAVLNRGDVIQFTGVNAVNPQNYRSTGRLADFVVTATVTADGAGLMTIPIQAQGMQGIVGPSVTPTPDPFQNVTNLPADTAPVLVFNVGTASFATIAGVNTPTAIGFHPDFATLVSADLYQPNGTDMAARKSDDQLGFSMRFIRDYDPVTDQLVNRFDVLFGWAMLRNELVCRVQS